MKKKNRYKSIIRKRSLNFINIFKMTILISFSILIIFMAKVSLIKVVAGENLLEFQKNRNIVNKVLYGERGNIYDTNGNFIAKTIIKYNLYAILDEKHSLNIKENEKKLHVTDANKAANLIAPIIGMDANDMIKILNKKNFQVEFAPYGNSLTQLQKEQIEKLDLEGFYFTSHESRDYVQGMFSSHMIGYANYNPASNHVEGVMGIEQLLDEKWLRGKDGIHKYHENLHGQKIKDCPEVLIPEEKGCNIYLTLDSFIQQQVESKLKEIKNKHNPKWASISVASPCTGEILAVGQIPNFDPNLKDITDYNNYFTQAEYEVGSIMKPITYASAIETGKYKGDKMVQTGSREIDGCRISDWNEAGWGNIPVDKGLFYSSNTIISDIVSSVLTKNEQEEYLKKFGFGKPTGIECNNEENGYINLENMINRVTTAYGQGSTATAAQMLQSYCALANKGSMKRLHLIDRIEDSFGNIKYKHNPYEIGKPISENTSDYVLKLLQESVNGEGAFSKRFKMKTSNLAGKTGTANVVDQKNGGYLNPKDHRNYVYSFAGISIPENQNANFVVLVSISQPQINPDLATETATKELLDNINVYLNSIKKDGKPVKNIQNVLCPSFLNYNVNDIEKRCLKYGIKKEDCVIIGNGDTVIKQNIKPYNPLYKEKLLLKTNYTELYLPDFNNWSRKDIEEYINLTGIKININGLGYVNFQSVPKGTKVDENMSVDINLSV